MIAKNIKGKSFGGCVRYVMNDGCELLAAEGVLSDDAQSIIRSFAVQRSGRLEIKQPVGHIPISFSPEDSPRMTNEFMLQLAEEYMQEMSIRNTQYIVVRHHNTANDHLHIVYNRIDNDLKLISVNNDYRRNVAICKKLKKRHNLTFGKGKENVRREKLADPDKIKYEIYDTIKNMLSYCTGYPALENLLRDFDITMQYKYRSGSEESLGNIQGISFCKGGIALKGSAIDRKFSHANLQKTFERNLKIQEQTRRKFASELANLDMSKYLPDVPKPPVSKPPEHPTTAQQHVHPPQRPETQPQKPEAKQSEPSNPIAKSGPESPAPSKPTRRNPTICGVTLTDQQRETLESGGCTYLENMQAKDCRLFSAYVALDDDHKRAFFFKTRPDEFVKYGKYEMRLMDKRRIEAGLIVRATVKWYDGRTARPYLWKENPSDPEYKESWSDPRKPEQKQEQIPIRQQPPQNPIPQKPQKPEQQSAVQQPIQQKAHEPQKLRQPNANCPFFVSPKKKSGPKL